MVDLREKYYDEVFFDWDSYFSSYEWGIAGHWPRYKEYEYFEFLDQPGATRLLQANNAEFETYEPGGVGARLFGALRNYHKENTEKAHHLHFAREFGLVAPDGTHIESVIKESRRLDIICWLIERSIEDDLEKHFREAVPELAAKPDFKFGISASMGIANAINAGLRAHPIYPQIIIGTADAVAGEASRLTFGFTDLFSIAYAQLLAVYRQQRNIRFCPICRGLVPPEKKRPAEGQADYCSPACRQKAHRIKVAAERGGALRPKPGRPPRGK